MFPTQESLPVALAVIGLALVALLVHRAAERNRRDKGEHDPPAT